MNAIDLQKEDLNNINSVSLLGEIKRGLNRQFYIPNLNTTVENLHNYSTGLVDSNFSSITNTNSTPAERLGYTWNGSLPTQVYKTYGESINEYFKPNSHNTYELNHLGNVRAVITDEKLLEDVNTNNSIDAGCFFSSNIVSFSDYYPFGMVMPGRNGGSLYRYSFQGQEKDDEVKGNGNSYTTEFRQYDPRLGRWLSTAPLKALAAGWTPYRFGFDNPMYFVDNTGLFETRKEAKAYKKNNRLKGQVSEDADGFSIDNKKAGTSIFKDADFGIQTGVLVQHNKTKPSTGLNKGSEISTPNGLVKINKFEFYGDPTQSGIQIEFNYQPSDNISLSKESSLYKWVQTVRTNSDINSSFENNNSFPSNSNVQFLDIADRKGESASIKYNSEGMKIEDILGRIPSKSTVNWQAETSLIKVDNAGELEKRIITLTWGFEVQPNGSSKSTGLKLKNKPSGFHNKVLTTNPAKIKELVP